MADIARQTFQDSPLRRELEKRIAELEAENLDLMNKLRVQKLS